MTLPSMKAVAAFAGIILVVAFGWFLPVREWTLALADCVRDAGALGVVVFVAAVAPGVAPHAGRRLAD